MTSIHTDIVFEDLSPESVFAKSRRQHDSVAVSTYLTGDNWVERIFAVILLVPTLPIIGILVLLVRFTSPGPGIFRQDRVGRNGKTYTMYKLRSMHCKAESQTGPVWSMPNDPRTTRIGAFLRKTHLDELPQLLNVVKGEMRLVGPRPERPEFVRVLEEEIPGYCERLRVLPGVTGLAQVNLAPDSSIDSVRRKLRLDVEYIQMADLFLDFQITLCTFLKVFFVPGDIRVRLTRVDRRNCLRGIGSRETDVALTPDQLEKQGKNGHAPLDRLANKPK